MFDPVVETVVPVAENKVGTTAPVSTQPALSRPAMTAEPENNDRVVRPVRRIVVNADVDELESNSFILTSCEHFIQLCTTFNITA